MKFTIRIVYKSGYSIDLKCSKFEVTRDINGNMTGLKYENLSPIPLFIGINNIESIFQID